MDYDIDIEANILGYLNGDGTSQGVKPLERYASFDYCFNYFQAFREQGTIRDIAGSQHLQTSCLQLGFFLASWGMLRGSASLLQRSVKIFEPVVVAIAEVDSAVWAIDADCYNATNIDLLLKCKRAISEAFGQTITWTDTLITKTMLGVFGNVPAFDTYFVSGSGISPFDDFALKTLSDFYQTYKPVIEQYRIPTLDFATGQPTHRRYTRAKVIDMVFFIEGSKRSSSNRA